MVTFHCYLSDAGQQGMPHCGKIQSAICLDMDLCPNSCLHGLRNTNREVQHEVLKKKTYKEGKNLYNKKLDSEIMLDVQIYISLKH